MVLVLRPDIKVLNLSCLVRSLYNKTDVRYLVLVGTKNNQSTGLCMLSISSVQLSKV